MSNLRTDYKDDVYTGNRKYRMSSNGDGTVSFTDETQYTQNGDRYGAEQINEVNGIINNLDNNVYKSTDAAMTDIADNDYIPIYDTSASARKKTLWSNIKNLFAQTFAIKVHSSNSAGTYGAGTDTYFGHVKLSDSYTSEFPQSASQSVGASERAVTNVYSELQTETSNRSRETSYISANLTNHLTANNKSIYMDYQNGKYGINTSANRSADTFIPFSGGNLIVTAPSETTITIPRVNSKNVVLFVSRLTMYENYTEYTSTFIYDVDSNTFTAIETGCPIQSYNVQITEHNIRFVFISSPIPVSDEDYNESPCHIRAVYIQ